MAITVTSLTTLNSSTDTDPYTTASVTPTAGAVVFVGIANAKGTTPETPTVGNAWGITAWTQIGPSGTYNSNQRRLTAYWGYASSYSAGTCTVSFGATQIGCQASFVQVTGLDTSTPVVTGNVDVDTGTATGTTALNLSALTKTTNGILVFKGHNASEGSTITGYTEIHDLSAPGSPTMGFLSAYLLGTDDASVDITWATSTAFRAIAFEMNAMDEGAALNGLNGSRMGRGGRWWRPAAVEG